MVYFNIFLTCAILIYLIYLIVKKKYSYWESKGVPFLKPTFPFGNFKGVRNKIHLSVLLTDAYTKLKGKFQFGGLYVLFAPLAIITDLNLIKNILVKDFNYFTDRGVYYNEEDDPLSAHLFSLDGQKWKSLRTKMTPTFTSGKLKMMLPIIVEVAEELKICMDKIIKEDSIIEIRDVLARYTTDNIGRCAFGIDCNSLVNPDNEFRRAGDRVFDKPRYTGLAVFLLFTFQEIGRRLHFKILHDDVSAFVKDVIEETIAHRELNNINRNDFIDLMLQIKNKGKLDDDESGELVSLTLNEIAAQAFIFFSAGFHTSSTTVAFALHELAINQEVQEKAREEIKTILEKYDGKITYEALHDMKYVENVLSETLRKYPVAASLVRKATIDYKVPDSEFIFKKGDQIMVPVYGIHHDSDYYPDPEVFDPDRFLPEVVLSRNQYSYIPFGEGPRICIGMRFGLLQAKIGLVTMLNSYNFQTCTKTVQPVEFAADSILLAPKDGIWLKIEKKKNKT